MATTYSFPKKYVLVTGSTKGIGKATAELFLKAGATVAINGRTKDGVIKVVKEFNDAKLSGKAIIAPGDATTAEGVKAIIAEVDKHGELDILVNNAATGFMGNLETTDDAGYLQQFEGNVLSAVRFSKHYLPKLLKKKEGRIINISSVVGLNPEPNMLAYSISKAALDGLTKALAQATTDTRVTVNSLTVGPTDTEAIDVLVADIAAQVKSPVDVVKAGFEKGFKDKGWYLNRWIKAKEVAEVVAFLASDAGLLVNGSAQRADGGMLKQF